MLDTQQSWKLFLATGLPEAYLYAKQTERVEGYAAGGTRNRPERGCIQGVGQDTNRFDR
ncbi:MAG: hypothetical protein LUE61_06290 [Clostridiales bacterium]|nr:hypothetical protein [Clostridiales bacterium]